MGIKNKTLTGKNLCWMNCTDRNSTIHPQTGDDQVLMTGYSNEQSLKKWIYSNPDNPDTDFVNTTSLKQWLLTNYPISGTATLPIASSTNLGCVKIIDTTYLTINNEGGLGVNVGNINNYIGQHINISLATFGTSGTIHLGNDLPLPSDFNNTAIRNSLNDKQLPLQLDSNGHAGTNVPKYNYSYQQEGFVYVESPSDATGKFLSANGTWENIPSATTYDTLSSTDYDNTKSYVIKGPGILDNTKYLSSNGTWTTPPSASIFTGATTTTDGTQGVVPAPYINDRNKFLSGSGTWKSVSCVTGITVDREIQSFDLPIGNQETLISRCASLFEEDVRKIVNSIQNGTQVQNIVWKFTGNITPCTGESNIWLPEFCYMMYDIINQYLNGHDYNYDIYITIEFTVDNNYSDVGLPITIISGNDRLEVLGDNLTYSTTDQTVFLDLSSSYLYKFKQHLTSKNVNLNPNVTTPVNLLGTQVSLKSARLSYSVTPQGDIPA